MLSSQGFTPHKYRTLHFLFNKRLIMEWSMMVDVDCQWITNLVVGALHPTQERLKGHVR